MPSAIRVPLPTTIIAVDPHFKIDIRNPTTGAVGLRVGRFADKLAYERTYLPRPGVQDRTDVLFHTQLWATFLHAKLGEESWRIEGLDAIRGDLTPYGPGPLPQAVHAFMPSSPKYDLMSRLTDPTMYNSLRPLLADIMGCQVVWFYKFLYGRVDRFDTLSMIQGNEGDIWRLWKLACPNMNHLDALYIVEIRSNFTF